MLEDILAVKHPSELEFMIHAFPWRNPDLKDQRRRIVIRVRCDSEDQRNEWSREITERLDEGSKRKNYRKIDKVY